MLEQRKLEKLFRQNYSKMLHLACVLLGDGAEAEDVVQNIFLKLAESDILPPNDSYLLTAVRNACLNRIRQMQVHQRVKNLLPVETETDQRPVKMEQLDEIAAFVDEQLEEPHHTIFYLRFDEDLTIAEIGRRLNLNPNTTYKYLMQGIQKIKNHFKHENYERGEIYPAASGNAR
ncbi:MAG: sigma-70 family RNA polymerase sigma factor [Bacteroidaceae bacterium]|nr:sigma-70 family RNA polymerase sigma factor [Bacteroidaceae bacterium]